MKTADGKKIILFCSECKRVKPWDNDGWTQMSAAAQAELAKNDHVAFVSSVCPSCERVK